ncbi:MAG TPA: ABC transporter substrate-binding protein, partial [Firmicutes bacterium]|nr:ABC transporter substrate-binding protein [Bacillota bacterium]
MQGISPEMKITDILEKYPGALEVFTANGFPATGKADLLRQVGPLLTLKTALKLKGLNP